MDNKIDNNYPIINQTNTYLLPNTTTQSMPQIEPPNTVFSIAKKDNFQTDANSVKISISDGGVNIGNDQTNIKFAFGIKGLEDITNIKFENIKVTFYSVEASQKINPDLTIRLGYKNENNIETFSAGCKWVF